MSAPVLSVVEGSNADLIAAAARLWIRPDDTVLDPTWGSGLWWKKYQHPGPFIAHDLYTLDQIDFLHLPEADATVDVVTFDPPYVSKGGRATSGIVEFDSRYGLTGASRTPLTLAEYNASALPEFLRVLRPGGRVLAKVSDYVSSGKLFLGRHHLVTAALDAGFEVWDEFVHHSGTGPQPLHNLDGSRRRQVHSRRAHSFLVVLGKRGRR